MDITYSRPVSRLERLLAQLVPARQVQEPVNTRIDFARGEDVDVEVMQA